MPPEASVPGTPQDWLRHALSDLAVASQPRDSVVLRETLCFHAQQAAEKSIKAVLVSRDVRFPYTHNLARLITLVMEAGITWPDELDVVADLTKYAVQTRYPGLPNPVSDEALSSAIDTARRAVSWAQSVIDES